MLMKKQLFLYLSVGIICAFIDIAISRLLVNFGLYYGLAVSIGFTVGLVINYFLHLTLTFNAAGTKSTLAKYGVVVATNYLITILFSFISINIFGDFLIGKIISLPVIAINGFILGRYWVFK